jgi:hypothetical protein
MGDTLFRGELCSRPWAVVLRDMEADGVSFSVNELRRSLSRQIFFWNCGPNGCCCCNNCNLAARPSPFAPHIRKGRPDHAADFDTLSHNINDVLGWLAKKGLKPTRPAGLGTIRWEPWHIEISLIALLLYYRQNKGDKFDRLPKHVEIVVRRFITARQNVRTRIEDRDRIDSKREPNKWKARDQLVDEAVEIRAKRRRRVERMLKRAKRAKTKRILREVLN